MEGTIFIRIIPHFTGVLFSFSISSFLSFFENPSRRVQVFLAGSKSFSNQPRNMFLASRPCLFRSARDAPILPQRYKGSKMAPFFSSLCGPFLPRVAYLACMRAFCEDEKRKKNRTDQKNESVCEQRARFLRQTRWVSSKGPSTSFSQLDRFFLALVVDFLEFL